MPIALVVMIVAIVVTVLLAAIGYMIDRSDAGGESQEDHN